MLARHRTNADRGARRYPYKICGVLLQVVKANRGLNSIHVYKTVRKREGGLRISQTENLNSI